MISHPLEARRLILEHISPIDEQIVIASAQAQGRVLRRDPSASCQLPPRDNAAMDGYALRWADLQQRTDLACIATLAAGQDASSIDVRPGTCVRIMTGASIPQGADTVIEYERTRVDGDQVFFEDVQHITAGTHIRRAGEDTAQGSPLQLAGQRIGPAQIMRLVSCAVNRVQVTRQPRVAVLSTGNELIAHDDWHSGCERIPDANGPGLCALVEQAGAQAISLGICPDDPAALARVFEQMPDVDLILTSAGISGSDFDFLDSQAAALGIEWIFQDVCQKPGKPMAFGTHRGRPLLALPGNPVSSFFCAWFYALPALRRLEGEKDCAPNPLQARVDFHFRNKGRWNFPRVAQCIDAHGALIASLPGDQGSHVLGPLAQGTAFAMLEPGRSYAPGDSVALWVYDHCRALPQCPG